VRLGTIPATYRRERGGGAQQRDKSRNASQKRGEKSGEEKADLGLRTDSYIGVARKAPDRATASAKQAKTR